MALKLLFDNTPSINERARRAIGRIVEYEENYPDWPKLDLAYSREECMGCGEIFWSPSNRTHECGDCRQLRIDLRKAELDEKRAAAAVFAEHVDV